MRRLLRYMIWRLPALLLLSSIGFSCANIGNPNGGPYDEDPPKFVSSKPAMNELNFKGKKIEVLFDELVTVDNPSENVIVTPPQKQNPIIQSAGKKVTVELKDTLKENTTYTIDFTSAIADNNEKNVFENFSFAFSTGDVIDSMEISGVLLNAEDLEPVQKTLVGIHNNLSDTAFTKISFLRSSKTDDRGHFTIRNIAPGNYHLFALDDKNRNYAYDKDQSEAIAFLDSIIIPSCERGMVPDTIWKDTITVDTVMMVEKTLFYPKNEVLKLFVDSVQPRQRLLKPDRPQDFIFTLKFSAPMDTFPRPVPLNFEPADSMWYVTQRGDDRESFSVNYWVLDSMIYNIDTMQVEVSYWKTNDSIPDLMELQTDTLKLVNKETAQRKKKAAKQKKPVKVRKNPDENGSDSIQDSEKETVVPLQLTIAPAGALNPYDVISVTFNEPVLDVQKDYFIFEQTMDSVWNPVEFEFAEDTTRAMTYLIKRPLKYDEKYRLTVDSAKFCGVYGHCNDSLTVLMTVHSEKDYGHLIINVKGLPSVEDSGQVVMPAFMELLNASGAPVRKEIVKDGVARFMDMRADKYYARITLDANGNGKWDYGNYEEKRQPEQVIYFSTQFEIRQNWKIDETWDISKSSPTEKPSELVKNKPKEETKKKRDYKEESKPRKRNSTSTNFGGLSGLGR